MIFYILEGKIVAIIINIFDRFNKLIKVIRASLQDIRKAIKGELIMSPAMEKAAKSLSDGKVPDMWMSASYPSLKGLGSYIIDLKTRIAGFKKWLDEGSPIVFWISGLYFTQSFLTGVLQNYARKYAIPIDEIVFDFEVKIRKNFSLTVFII